MVLIPTYYETNALGVLVDTDEINLVYMHWGMLFSASGECIGDGQCYSDPSYMQEYCHVRLSPSVTGPEK
ncbi:hypothetical protein [Vibrio phage PhiImVa-1]|nr:hypothetical protein [Vibrio phage PhiImVa-1]